MVLRLGALFFVVSLVFWLWAIFDSITTDDGRVRNLPKWAWLLIILLFFEVGALIWVLFGRPKAGVSRAGEQPGTQRRPFPGQSPQRPQRRPRGPVGPDDDPDFLGTI